MANDNEDVVNMNESLFLQMEKCREKIPHVTRKDYIPNFILKCLHDKLVSDSVDQESSRLSHGSFYGWSKRNEESMMWTDNTLLEDNADFEGEYLLSEVNRNDAGKILRFARNAVDCNLLDKRSFGRCFVENFENPCLELLYLMDVKYKLLPVPSYIMLMKETSQINYFKQQLMSFMFSPVAFTNEHLERSNAILEHFLQCVILTHFCNRGGKAELVNGKERCGDILKAVTLKLINDGQFSKVNLESSKTVLAVMDKVGVPESVRMRYYFEHVGVILNSGKKPFRTNLEILKYQEQYADPLKILEKECLQQMISQMICSTLSSADTMAIISSALAGSNYNWEIVLCMVSIWIDVKGSSATSLLKQFIKTQICDGLVQKNEDFVQKGFILARHCSLVAAPLFSRYEKWFTNLFESEKYSPASDNESFTWMTSMFSSWVETEPSCFLHVQIAFRPFIPKGCREIWNDYLSLAQIRLLEYKEVERAMEYEPDPNNPVLHEVEMAVKAYETHGKIPQNIFSMSLLRKSYFQNEFIPMLLRKPTGTALSDARLRLIEMLHREGKLIPNEVYQTYKANNAT